LRTEAELSASAGRYDEAMLLVENALHEAEEVRLYTSSLLSLRADLLVHGGTSDQIETAYEEAIRSAAGCSARFEQLQTTTHFARWLKSQDRDAEALAMLAEIYGWFTEGFDTLPLREARVLLVELGACGH
jgi:adenylate cyclase